MRSSNKFFVITLSMIFPSIVIASGTAEQYFIISLIISIPSFIAMIVLFIYIVNKSKLTTKDSLKTWVISFVSLMVIGIGFPGGDKFFPNWFIYMNNEFASPIVTSLIGSFLLLIIYVSKWNALHQPLNEEVPSTEDENESKHNEK